MPSASQAAAVPAVATMVKPRSAKRRAAVRPAGLSRSASERNTEPRSGSLLPTAVWLLAKATPKVRSMPMTSPVERISGPRRVSTPKRSKGSAASFTATCPPPSAPALAGMSPSARSSASVAPTMSRAATLASGTAVALETNGTVRLARGLASRM